MRSVDSDADATQPQDPLMAQLSVGRFRLVRKIGSGGMGDVYLAEDAQLSRTVVLKFLSSAVAANDESKKRFYREAQAAAKLNHPNIVTIYEVGELHGRPYIAMEYLKGLSLREIRKGRTLSLPEVVDIAIQLCQGLKAAHGAGVIHRDIKPDNILFDGGETYKLLDFGLASLVGDATLTKDGSLLGTVGYMSPEQVRGEPVDAASDLFSLGVVLFELITETLPFHHEYEAAILHAILNDEPPKLTDLRPDVPLELAAVLERCLAKERTHRYSSAAAVLSDLKDVSSSLNAPTSPAHRARRQPSVAVLPFANLSADRDQDYFCDGISEELINALNHAENLRVVARTSSFSFKGKDIDIREIGRRLNVDNVLEGSVRKAGNRLRVIAQLIAVSDGYHLWSERFDRQMEDVFAIQDEISLTIVDRLKVKLLEREKSQLTKRYTASQGAYNLYLKGRYFWNRRHEGGLQKGIEAFEQATLQDPMYAPAYVGIADCLNQLAHWGYAEPKETYRAASRATEKALSIDSSLAEAHASLGWIKLWHDWDWEGSEREFKRALELNPNYAMAHEWYALYLAVMQRMDEAFAEVGQAARLDPISLVVNSIIGLGHYWARRFDDAVAQLGKTIELDPSFPQTYLYLGWSYAGKSAWPQAIAACEKFHTLTNGSVISLGYLGAVTALAGHAERARELLDQLDFLAAERYASPMYRALIHMGLGEVDLTMKYLELARQQRESFLPVIYSFPLMDSIRDDARFAELLKKMGLEVH